MTAQAAPHRVVWPDAAYLVQPISGLDLFPEEQLTAQRAMARWAMAQGIAVAPVDAAEDRLRAHARGLDGQGRRCGRPLSRWRAIERYGNELKLVGKLSTSVHCGEEGCSLVVTQFEGVDPVDSHLEQRWETAYEAGVELSEQLVRLAPRKLDNRGVGGLLLGSLTSGPVSSRPERLEWNARSAGPKRKDVGVALADETPLRRCLAPWRGAELLLGLGPLGDVTRCALRGVEDPASRCVCDTVLRHLSGPASAQGMRVVFHARHVPADVMAEEGHVVHGFIQTHLKRDPDHPRRTKPNVSHPSIEGWNPPPFSTVAICFADRDEVRRDRYVVDTYFGATGEVRDVVIRNGEELSPQTAACVQSAFRKATTPCPALSQTGARAVLAIHVEKVGTPRPGLLKALDEAAEEPVDLGEPEK